MHPGKLNKIIDIRQLAKDKPKKSPKVAGTKRAIQHNLKESPKITNKKVKHHNFQTKTDTKCLAQNKVEKLSKIPPKMPVTQVELGESHNKTGSSNSFDELKHPSENANFTSDIHLECEVPKIQVSDEMPVVKDEPE